MSLLDTLRDTVTKILPQKEEVGIPKPGSLLHDDNMIISKPVIVVHAFGIFFAFLAMCCFASVAAFQAHWEVGPSGLTGFAIFASIFSMFLSFFLLLVPVVYEKYDKLVRLARALQEVRVGFILAGTGLFISFLISFITIISAFTEPGCKNPDNDPNAKKGADFKNGLTDWCNTKKAGSFFFWFATICWIAIFVLRILDWRNGKSTPRRDPNFNPPSQMYVHEEFDEDDDDESRYNLPLHASTPAPQIPPFRHSTNDDVASPFSDANQYHPEPAAGRPSMDAYGAFSDPAPSGFGPTSPSSNPTGISRTMQYADPYAAVRATIGNPQPASYQGF
ncbi:hypothetical protein M422DRAFT_223330 [Sphaerobolus stellatus SS14]|nr:hypothetical protein M422DRAFT_223330 [Sphaerobolus stellatus SS14]